MFATRQSLAFLLTASLAPTAFATTLTVSLIDLGVPQIPSSLDPSGYLAGYSAYTLQFATDTGTISAFDFGSCNAGALTGNFLHATLDSDAISFPRLQNLDSRFLTSDGWLTIASNPPAPISAPFSLPGNFSLGNSLSLAAGLTASVQSSTLNVAYLVMPTGSPLSFTGAQVALMGTPNSQGSRLISLANPISSSSNQWTFELPAPPITPPTTLQPTPDPPQTPSDPTPPTPTTPPIIDPPDPIQLPPDLPPTLLDGSLPPIHFPFPTDPISITLGDPLYFTSGGTPTNTPVPEPASLLLLALPLLLRRAHKSQKPPHLPAKPHVSNKNPLIFQHSRHIRI